VSKHRDDIDHAQAAQWGEIRDAAYDTLVTGARYVIAVGAQVHHVATMDELAAVTRRERKMHGVEWQEDPGARPARRWS
jgi:hypothetical protein